MMMYPLILKKRLQAQWDVLKKLTQENKALKQKIAGMKAEKYTRVVARRGIKKTVLSKLKSDIKNTGCCLCGYNKCAAAMDFHHVKSKGQAIAQIKSLEDFIEEFETHRVVVLCALCHREFHHGFIDPDFTGKEVDISPFLKYETKRTDRRGNKRWVK